MAERDWGNAPQFSTVASTTSNGADPTTATICAEIQNLKASKNYEARFIVGASTATSWLLEHCISTGLGSTAITNQTKVFTGSNQSAEYVMTYHTGNSTTDLVRVRNASTFTGDYACEIQAEILT